MNNLYNRFERFCLRHRKIGIPNLMMFVMIGNGLLYLLSMVDIAPFLPLYFHFSKQLILQGQVWRLFSYVFLDFRSNPFFMILFMYVYYSVSRQIEDRWGTFRFNLYYFTGIIITDVFCMITDSPASAYYLHLSLFMVYATLHYDSGFMLFLIIPVKGWMLVLVDLVLTGYDIYRYPSPFCFVPVIALVIYLLFVGPDITNILPPYLRRKLMYRRKRKNPGVSTTPPPIAFTPAKPKPQAKPDFSHRCTVCGRTDVTNPELEFRYCSRCNGYHCYCEDHISNHSHIQ